MQNQLVENYATGISLNCTVSTIQIHVSRKKTLKTDMFSVSYIITLPPRSH